MMPLNLGAFLLSTRTRKTRKRRIERIRLQPKSQRVDLGICKLEDGIVARIEELVLLGVPESSAHEYLGISRRTFFYWKRWGTDYLEAESGNRIREHRRYAKFVIRLRRAKATWQVNIMRRSFQRAYQPTWVRDLSLLERRDRENWSKNVELGTSRDKLDPDESFL